MDTVVANSFRFDDDTETTGEKWGFWKDNSVIINGTIFNRLMKQGGFQGKSFLSWAKKKNLLECDPKGNPKKVVKFLGNSIRAVVIRTDYGMEENPVISTVSDDFSEELPFK